MQKKCIFHIPIQLTNSACASQIRPRKMIEAFKDCGYQVDVIEGYGAERKKIIKRIKMEIKSGGGMIFSILKVLLCLLYLQRKHIYQNIQI